MLAGRFSLNFETDFMEKNLPPSSFEQSLGGPCAVRFPPCRLCCPKLKPFAVPIALRPLKPTRDGWFGGDPVTDGANLGLVRNGLPKTLGMPNCKNGAHGATAPRFRGAKWAAAAAYSCNAGWRPAFEKFGKPWCSSTIFFVSLKLNNVLNISCKLLFFTKLVRSFYIKFGSNALPIFAQFSFSSSLVISTISSFSLWWIEFECFFSSKIQRSSKWKEFHR